MTEIEMLKGDIVIMFYVTNISQVYSDASCQPSCCEMKLWRQNRNVKGEPTHLGNKMLPLFMGLVIATCHCDQTFINGLRRGIDTTKDVPVDGRTKRAVFWHFIDPDSAAIQRLLTSARKIWSRSPQHNRYQKDGTFQQALQDFYSVRPREITHYTYAKKVSKVTGKVGNKQLILTRASKTEHGKTCLEIRDADRIKTDFSHLHTVVGEPYDKIIYKPNK